MDTRLLDRAVAHEGHLHDASSDPVSFATQHQEHLIGAGIFVLAFVVLFVLDYRQRKLRLSTARRS